MSFEVSFFTWITLPVIIATFQRFWESIVVSCGYYWLLHAKAWTSLSKMWIFIPELFTYLNCPRTITLWRWDIAVSPQDKITNVTLYFKLMLNDWQLKKKIKPCLPASFAVDQDDMFVAPSEKHSEQRAQGCLQGLRRCALTVTAAHLRW